MIHVRWLAWGAPPAPREFLHEDKPLGPPAVGVSRLRDVPRGRSARRRPPASLPVSWRTSADGFYVRDPG